VGIVTRVLLVGRAGLVAGQDHQTAMLEPALRAHSEFTVVGAVADLATVDLVGVDAVSVCVPPDERADTVVAALDAGLHVLADKPLAMTPAEVARIAVAQRRAGTALAVALHQRFQPMVAAAAAALAAGRVGLPWNVQADLLVAGGDPVPDELDNLACHPVDAVLAMTGLAVRRVYARSAGDGLVLLLLDHEQELTSTILVGRTGPRLGVPPAGTAVHRYRVAGTHGTATFDLTKPALDVTTATAHERRRTGPDSVALLVADWHDAIRDARPPRASIREAVAVAEVLGAARRSLESGRPEAIKEEERA
jgi:predicted dehydrogenase